MHLKHIYASWATSPNKRNGCTLWICLQTSEMGVHFGSVSKQAKWVYTLDLSPNKRNGCTLWICLQTSEMGVHFGSVSKQAKWVYTLDLSSCAIHSDISRTNRNRRTNPVTLYQNYWSINIIKLIIKTTT